MSGGSHWWVGYTISSVLTLQIGAEKNLIAPERHIVNPDTLCISKYSKDSQQVFFKEWHITGFVLYLRAPLK